MPQVFFLTGSSRGLGRQIAEAALAAGHRLVATARRPDTLADLAGRYGSRILPVALDVTDPDAAVAAVAAGAEAFGRIDVVVNNAGYANLAAVEDMTLADFRAQVEANLFGVVNVTKAALPLLREQGGGHIIQVSSIGGRLATAGLSAYQAAKWAVGGFSEVLAKEVGPFGIKGGQPEPADVAVGGRLDAPDDLGLFLRLEQVRVPGLDAQVVGDGHLVADRGGAGHCAGLGFEHREQAALGGQPGHLDRVRGCWRRATALRERGDNRA
jgi:NAD(P)-dependent dehydrogenase (short-subunit alcohol dehydrogenase family)